MFREGNGMALQYSCLENPWTENPGGLQSVGSRRVQHDWATSLSLFTFHFHALEKEMATHSSVLAWRIPGTGKPGRLPSIGSHRVRHDWSDLAAAAEYLKHAGFCAGTVDRNKNKSRYSCSKSSWWWERQTNNSNLCSGLWISPGLGPERHGNPEKVEGCTGTRGWEGGRDESIQQEVVLKLRLAETWRPTEAG